MQTGKLSSGEQLLLDLELPQVRIEQALDKLRSAEALLYAIANTSVGFKALEEVKHAKVILWSLKDETNSQPNIASR